MYVSALTGQGMAELTRCIQVRAQHRVGVDDDDTPVITQARHRDGITHALEGLTAFLSAEPPDLELRAEELRRAAAALGRITGRIDVEDVLDHVFGRFCIGK